MKTIVLALIAVVMLSACETRTRYYSFQEKTYRIDEDLDDIYGSQLTPAGWAFLPTSAGSDNATTAMDVVKNGEPMTVAEVEKLKRQITGGTAQAGHDVRTN